MASTSTNGTSATTAPIQFGRLVDHRAHQFAAGRSALRRDIARLGIAGVDQPAGDIDEIVEGVGAALELPVEEPLIAKVVAAADMGDGERDPAIDQAEAAGRETGRDGKAVGAIGIDEELARSVELAVLEAEDRDGDQFAVAGGDHQPVGGVFGGVVARGNFLDLEHFQPIVGGVIIIGRAGGDHRRIMQAIRVGGEVGIAREAGAVARLGERDAMLVAGGIIAQHELVEAVDAAGDQQMIAVAGDPAKISAVASRDDRRPVGGSGRVGAGDPEIDVIVVGQDPQFAVRGVDFILDVGRARADQGQRRDTDCRRGRSGLRWSCCCRSRR